MKTKQIIMLFLSGNILLTGCGSSDYEDKIIGKYYSIDYTPDIDWDEEMPVAMTNESYEEFLPDNLSIEEGLLKFSILNEKGKNIHLTYNYGPDTVEWKIKDRKIYYVDPGLPDFKLTYKNTNASRDAERTLVSNYRSFIENDFVDITKQDFLQHGIEPDTIIQLNNKYLVTAAKDGQRTVSKRISETK